MPSPFGVMDKRRPFDLVGMSKDKLRKKLGSDTKVFIPRVPKSTSSSWVPGKKASLSLDRPKKKKTKLSLQQQMEKRLLERRGALLKTQEELEKERLKANENTLTIVDVDEKDKDAFNTKVEEAAKATQAYIFRVLAPMQVGVQIGIDLATQQLDIHVEKAVSHSASRIISRISDEIAQIALVVKFGELHGISPDVLDRILDAKIEFLRPRSLEPVGQRTGLDRPVKPGVKK